MISVKDWNTLLTIVRLKSRIAISKEDSLRLSVLHSHSFCVGWHSPRLPLSTT